jgi:Fe-S cluster assembly ATPase SufC
VSAAPLVAPSDLKEEGDSERVCRLASPRFQYPTELPGVGNTDFLRLMLNAKRKSQGLTELDPCVWILFFAL